MRTQCTGLETHTAYVYTRIYYDGHAARCYCSAKLNEVTYTKSILCQNDID